LLELVTVNVLVIIRINATKEGLFQLECNLPTCERFLKLLNVNLPIVIGVHAIKQRRTWRSWWRRRQSLRPAAFSF